MPAHSNAASEQPSTPFHGSRYGYKQACTNVRFRRAYLNFNHPSHLPKKDIVYDHCCDTGVI